MNVEDKKSISRILFDFIKAGPYSRKSSIVFRFKIVSLSGNWNFYKIRFLGYITSITPLSLGHYRSEAIHLMYKLLIELLNFFLEITSAFLIRSMYCIKMFNGKIKMGQFPCLCTLLFVITTFYVRYIGRKKF